MRIQSSNRIAHAADLLRHARALLMALFYTLIALIVGGFVVRLWVGHLMGMGILRMVWVGLAIATAVLLASVLIDYVIERAVDPPQDADDA